jgi:hypothetical protein
MRCRGEAHRNSTQAAEAAWRQTLESGTIITHFKCKFCQWWHTRRWKKGAERAGLRARRG